MIVVKSSRLEACLTVIALSIFADDHVDVSEVETFMLAAQKLPVFKDESFSMTEIELLAWYKANKIRILTTKNSDDYKNWLPVQLDNVSNKDDQSVILNIMKDISLADEKYHVREKALIIFIARYWNITFSHV